MRLSFEDALAGRRVFVTGNTGFTGSWTCLWLHSIGATVGGFSLPPETSPSLFETANLASTVSTVLADVRDAEAVGKAVRDFAPDVILHLAAQPLVRRSYREPLETFAVNVMGTAHVLEAARKVPGVRGVLCVTTDKVYKNKEWPWPYRENDPLGGKDPYSASKSAAEMVIQSYAASFARESGHGPAIGTVRAGNIIGGGDWSEDRLIPDFVRAVVGGSQLMLRYPEATRPWQHVLALVHGNLVILAGLLGSDPARYARAWNLGPQETKHYSVRDVLELMSQHWKRPRLHFQEQPLPEAGVLALDSSLARNFLQWSPPWDTEAVIAHTASWYRDYYCGHSSARRLTECQIEQWRAALVAKERT